MIFFDFFQDLFWKLYGIFSEKYSQKYAVEFLDWKYQSAHNSLIDEILYIFSD